MTTHDNRVYLEHILDCAKRIRDYTCGGKAEFMESALVQGRIAALTDDGRIDPAVIGRPQGTSPGGGLAGTVWFSECVST